MCEIARFRGPYLRHGLISRCSWVLHGVSTTQWVHVHPARGGQRPGARCLPPVAPCAPPRGVGKQPGCSARASVRYWVPVARPGQAFRCADRRWRVLMRVWTTPHVLVTAWWAWGAVAGHLGLPLWRHGARVSSSGTCTVEPCAHTPPRRTTPALSATVHSRRDSAHMSTRMSRRRLEVL